MNKETRRKNFERLAQRRVNEALDKIESLKAFTNKSFYCATPTDFKKIVKALEEAITDLKKCYFEKGRKESFTL